MKWIPVASAAAIALSACGTDRTTSTASSPGATAPSAMSATQPVNAANFATMAASSGMYEVMSSQLAMSRSQSQVRALAQQMIQDHDRANRELMQIAAASGIQVPSGMMPRHQRMMDELGATGAGATFDQRYVQQQRMAHEEAVALFSSYAQGGDKAQLRDFARRTLPVLQQHHQMVSAM